MADPPNSQLTFETSHNSQLTTALSLSRVDESHVLVKVAS